jgi:hydrogenase maturation protease
VVDWAAAMQPGRCLVIGIGNPDRGDDAVGRIVARRLQAQKAPGVRVVEHSGEAASLIVCLDGAEAAYLIDAMVTGAPPGTISRFDVAATELPRVMFGMSTHGLGLAEAIELGRALGRLPRRCIVYGIEARTFEIGDPLLPEVAVAVEEVATLIRSEMRDAEAG